MIASQGYAMYAKSKAQTASQADLVLMLYEGAIKFGNLAVVAMEKKDVQESHNNIRKVENIVRELDNTLDFKYPVAKDFDRVYDYLLWRIRECNMRKDPAIMEEILTHLRTMRDTWKEVMRTANQGKKSPA